MSKSNVNLVIVRSIPLNRKVKQYWVKKYERVVANCGLPEAVAKFKQLRVTILSYLSDENRMANLPRYLRETGFRTNGHLRALFAYAETQPHFLLSFLKLYTGDARSEMTSEEAAIATRSRLWEVKSNPSVPAYLEVWLRYCLEGIPFFGYAGAMEDERNIFHKFAKATGPDLWCQYFRRWRRILAEGWKSKVANDSKQYAAFPEVYADYTHSEGSTQGESKSYDRDLAHLVAMHLSPDCPISGAGLDYVDSFLDDEVRDTMQMASWGHYQPQWDGVEYDDPLLGQVVGQVQHIHKKGGGTDLRDIAVPNRFVQTALRPGALRLYEVVRRLPKDATFDQGKFDMRIQNRVNNPNLYQGSVDLSKATDNLPREWGFRIVSALQLAFDGESRERTLYHHGTSSKSWEKEQRDIADVSESLSLFEEVSRAAWEDEGFITRWEVGQPLGSLPSFALLAITHNLLVESLGLSLGLAHSPYFILGDDIVITNKKLRARYIRELQSRGVPLSLHKSFAGRLSEFAGKTYVKGSVPFYCSDHNSLTWEALFDWQRTTGIRVPWGEVPRAIQRKWMSRVREEMTRASGETCEPSKGEVTRLAPLAYHLVQVCEVPGRGTHIYPIKDSGIESKRMVSYFEHRSGEPEPSPDAVRHTGITAFAGGHPVRLLSSRLAAKDGYFQRFRPVELPSWYRAKVRPVATDAMLKASLRALLAHDASKETSI